MRKIYDPISGADVTGTVQATLRGSRTFVTCYLYHWLFMLFFDYTPYGAYGTYNFTDCEWPVFTNYLQLSNKGPEAVGWWDHQTLQPYGINFYPETISHDKLSYGIGFEDKPVEVKFSPSDAIRYGVKNQTTLGSTFLTYPDDCYSPANLTLRQCFSLNMFTECPFWIHKAIFSDFPINGGTLLGTTLMFRGFIRGVQVSDSNVKIKLASLMDVFNTVQFPTQIITPNNRQIPFLPVVGATYGGDFSFVNMLTGSLNAMVFTTSQSVPVNAMRDYTMTMYPNPFGYNSIIQSGYPTAKIWRVSGNTAPGSPAAGQITVFFYDPVVVPSSISYLSWGAQLSHTGGRVGFPYVPPPEYNV